MGREGISRAKGLLHNILRHNSPPEQEKKPPPAPATRPLPVASGSGNAAILTGGWQAVAAC
jgi:hypothetical protein